MDIWIALGIVIISWIILLLLPFFEKTEKDQAAQKAIKNRRKKNRKFVQIMKDWPKCQICKKKHLNISVE